jgi:hypothetical protein
MVLKMILGKNHNIMEINFTFKANFSLKDFSYIFVLLQVENLFSKMILIFNRIHDSKQNLSKLYLFMNYKPVLKSRLLTIFKLKLLDIYFNTSY